MTSILLFALSVPINIYTLAMIRKWLVLAKSVGRPLPARVSIIWVLAGMATFSLGFGVVGFAITLWRVLT